MSQGSAPAEGCWAVVPVKRLAAAKSRLAGELDAAERRSLSLAMFEDVLAALRATPGIDATLVVTSDPEVHTYAARAGASVLADPTETNAELAASNDSESGLPSAALSRAVNAGVRAAAGCGASRVLYIAADVPLAAPAAIARLVEPGTADGCIVAARRDQGTNALCVPADVGFGFDFSPQSAALHVAHASARGIRLETLHEPTLALDVDVPADLRELALAAPGGATGRWLAKFQRAVEPTSVSGVTRAAADDFARAPLAELLARAAAIRDARGSPVLTYSRKVFIPLTRLCRDVCHYCTFAKTPRHLEAAYLSRDEVIAIARRGAAAGCAEALFTLGDRPETRYREAREALAALGHRSTVGYLAEVAQLVLEETGLLPHINAGVLSEDEYRELRAVAPSMGLMLETSSARLSERGGAHFGSPDKDPGVRLASIATAGRLKIPFTTGILVGIGETRAERLDSLYALRDLHATYGHLQEIIVQNFVPKPDTLMRTVPALTTEELLWTVAMARLVFGSEMSIQVPPNLNPDAIEALVAAGINDFGGISPVTPDHVNPESPWPEIEVLAATLRSSGRVLVPATHGVPGLYRGAPRLDRPATPPGGAAARGCGRTWRTRSLARGAIYLASRASGHTGQRARVLAVVDLRFSAHSCRGGREVGGDRGRAPVRGARVGVRSSVGSRGRGAPLPRGRHGHLCREPQYQLHQPVYLPLYVLCILQGTRRGGLARTGLPARARRDRAAHRRGGGAGSDRGVPAGRNPSLFYRRDLSRDLPCGEVR